MLKIIIIKDSTDERVDPKLCFLTLFLAQVFLYYVYYYETDTSCYVIEHKMAQIKYVKRKISYRQTYEFLNVCTKQHIFGRSEKEMQVNALYTKAIHVQPFE